MQDINGADTAWILISAALVMFMTPGLALFYGGLVRSKNVLGTIMQSFFALGLVSVLWLIFGYTIAFGPDHARIIGDLSYFGFRHVGATPFPAVGNTPSLAPTIPHTTYAVYQMMFAVITPALIYGAVAERMKFRAYLIFTAIWTLLVYSPVAHWVWGGGWLGMFDGSVKALDFAGGTVVHINAGIAALACILYIGKRQGYPHRASHPHNIPMMMTGAAILWFGWFGFNGGSALASGGLASSAFLATHLGAAGAMLGWIIPEWSRNGAPTSVGAATGAVAGLVAITPAAGYVEPWAACVIGFIAGVVCYYAVSLKSKIGYDDTLDVVGVHLLGGIVGALLTGVFATLAVNPAGANGLAYGNAAQVGRQAIAIGATMVFSFVMSMAILKVTDWLAGGVRVTEDEEYTGLDLSQHAESAYSLADSGTLGEHR